MKRVKTAVITGAAGFIGSHMVDLLLTNGYCVKGIDNFSAGRTENLDHQRSDPNLSLIDCDIRNSEECREILKGTDYIFHFAGIADIVPSIERPVDYVSVNLMGTINLLEAARAANVKKFVYTASSSCYGLTQVLPTSEDADIIPEHPYALSKAMGEEAVMHWGKVYGLPVVSIRIFNAYGPRSRTTGAYGAVFGVFLAQKLAGKPFTVVGDGKQSRDFLYVTDVVRAFLLAAESSHEQRIYNLGAGNPQTINRLVELLEGPVVHVPKRPGEPDCTWADITRIKSELKWEPQISFEEGVNNMLGQIENWSDAPIWDVESIKSATETWFSTLSGDGI